MGMNLRMQVLDFKTRLEIEAPKVLVTLEWCCQEMVRLKGRESCESRASEDYGGRGKLVVQKKQLPPFLFVQRDDLSLRNCPTLCDWSIRLLHDLYVNSNPTQL